MRPTVPHSLEDPEYAHMPDAAPPADLVDRLAAIGQDHLLRFYSELSDEHQQKLIQQLRDLDLDAIPRLIEAYVRSKPVPTLPAGVEPAPYYPANPGSPERSWDAQHYRRIGEELLRAGKVAAFTVAGGQGTRLGFEGPKGCYPAGAVTNKPLFQIFAEGLLAARRKYGRIVPWYIMTSPLNHQATIDFFRSQDFFGLGQENLMFFPQGVMPSFEVGSGRLLLAEKDELAANPDGHGGSIRALHMSGALEDMKRRGVEHISYFQVDNPIVKVIDPVFIGLHAGAPDSSAEMSSKMVPKAYAEEKMGVFCRAGGRTLVIEYSDLPAHLAHDRAPDGSLRYIAGSIAVHIIAVEFVERLNTDSKLELPYHRADKKVPHVDLSTGTRVEPSEPNGVKLERFVFDAVPLCRESIVYESDRVEEFAPIKNASGVDSPQSCREIQTLRAARWLSTCGVEIPLGAQGRPDCTLEISPLTAMGPEDLDPSKCPAKIDRSATLAL
jgi:UDP-N-acetylglucosamine/UDP-N-acetylgalactosamine diphosphorylase